MAITLAKGLCITILLILLIPNLRAATYYISTNGNDLNPGTQISPWRNCPGMTSWSGKALLNPGDIVYFKNTDVWSASIGALSTFFELMGGVTYNGRSWGSQGSLATISAMFMAPANSDNSCTVIGLYTDHPTKPTVFDGFKVLPYGICSGISLDFPTKFNNMTGAVKRIQNCIVDGAKQNVDESYGITSQPYNGKIVQNVEILNNIVRNCMRDGIYIYPGNENLPNILAKVTIRGNECYLNGRSKTSTGSGIQLKNHVKDSVIEYNYVHNNWGVGISLTSSDGLVMPGPENINIRYNLVINANRFDTAYKWNAGLIVYPGEPGDMSLSANIYGNIFWNPALDYGIFIQEGLDNKQVNLKIYNNIIYAGKGTAFYNEANDKNMLIDLTNNIMIANSGQNVFYDEHNLVKTHRTNIYWKPSGGTLVSINGDLTTFTAANLASWERTAFSNNPNFKNPSNLPTEFLSNPTRPNNDGLSIISGSAVGHGTNLGSAYSGSINSVLRSSTFWDIGAYQTSRISYSKFKNLSIHSNFKNLSIHSNNFDIRRKFTGKNFHPLLQPFPSREQSYS